MAAKKHRKKLSKPRYKASMKQGAFAGRSKGLAKPNLSLAIPGTPPRRTTAKYGLLSPGDSPKEKHRRTMQLARNSNDVEPTAREDVTENATEEEKDVGDTITVNIHHFCNRGCAVYQWVEAGLDREAMEAGAEQDNDVDIDDSASDIAWQQWEETGIFPDFSQKDDDTHSIFSERDWE